MPDTGAPWEIPFLDGTELVRAYPAFSEDLAEQIADGLSAAGNEGIGSNVAQTILDTAFSASVSAQGTTAITGLTVNFTPSSDTAKVLLIGHVSLSKASSVEMGMKLLRGTTEIGGGDFGAAGNRGTSGVFVNGSATQTGVTVPFVFLDAPGTASQVTYSVSMFNSRNSTQTLQVNNFGGGSGIVGFSGSSTITAMEVAA